MIMLGYTMSSEAVVVCCGSHGAAGGVEVVESIEGVDSPYENFGRRIDENFGRSMRILAAVEIDV
jgi:hypothetical protein